MLLKTGSFHFALTEYYAQKTFATKVKIYYFVLKIVAIIIAVAVVCYLISGYFPGLFGFIPGLAWLKKQSDTNDSKKSNNGELEPHNEETQSPSSGQVEQKIDIIIQALQEAPQQNQKLPARSAQGLNQINIQEPSETFLGRKRMNPLAYNPPITVIDRRLVEMLAEQIEKAKGISLKPTEMHSDVVGPNRGPIDNRKPSEILAQQIEYAKSIGLVPTARPK